MTAPPWLSPGKDSYRGRFAPSPTGKLHFGSLLAAVASYLDARANDGLWLLRIDDLDPPREQPGAARHIIDTLANWGMVSDEPVVWQSQRSSLYEQNLQALIDEKLAYPCSCSRSQLKRLASAGKTATGDDGAIIYPGTCRNAATTRPSHHAIRLRTDTTQRIAFDDAIQGPQQQDVAREVGDFVLRRADGLWAYQLAVVSDDWQQGITHVVRGADLLPSTARQICLQQKLGAPTPHYAHLPIAKDKHGNKLSKQTFARPIPHRFDTALATRVLDFLNQPGLRGSNSDPREFWQRAAERWMLRKVPTSRTERSHY